ncbi:hypothetical protein FZEAL_305 [Fusarium zealandicum]|uniref:Protamine P1 n=1 Tax=Fusarium zealandicum TaxID=1053134 RepID=A0A8H4XPY8_9HYPO|nr:hypothetical protein FZEAL_305 [Fusarium zealandicum]
MQRVDPSADELGLDWGEDSIYCEATCRPEDVLYEGSDDEDYDKPISRKLRCEAAGQRYLDGKTPFILTAVLKGPFDGEKSGWVNPWRSKYRTANTSQGTRTSPGKLTRSAKVKRNVSIPETIQSAPKDSLECHLPSPESLKQASVTEPHPYLEEDELAIVQEWRSTVEPIEVVKDRFWASTPQGSRSERKRKARGSSWLKLLANKRQRMDIMESGSVNTPVPRRSQPTDFPRDDVEHDKTLNSSFRSAPDRLPSSNTASVRFFSEPRNSDWEHVAQVADDTDELGGPLHDSTVTTFGTSIKRISPYRDVVKDGLEGEAKHAEDELSRDKIASVQAAASLSAPTSECRFAPASVSGTKPSQHSLRQQMPNKPALSRQLQGSESHDSNVEDVLMLPAGYESGDPSPAFETQEDQSFCFKMRPKPSSASSVDEPRLSRQRSKSPQDIEGNDEDTWSGLSSLKDDIQFLDAVVSPKESANTDNVDIGSGSSGVDLMDIDKRDVSSDLSIISSEEFNGFDVSKEPICDSFEIETASDTSSTSNSDTESVSSHNEAEGVIEVADTPSPDEAQERLEAANEEIRVVVEDDNVVQLGNVSAHEDDSSQDTDEQEEEENAIDSLSSASTASGDKPSQVSFPKLPSLTKVSPIKLTPSKPSSSLASPLHAELLLSSVKKRFIPQSSWAKLCHLTGSPLSSPARPSPCVLSAAVSPSNTINTHKTMSPMGSKVSTSLLQTRSSPQSKNGSGDTPNESTPRPTPTCTNADQTPSRTEPSTKSGNKPVTVPKLASTKTTSVLQDRQETHDAVPKEDSAVRSSQQSPWAGSKLSQYASLATGQLSTIDGSQCSTPSKKLHDSPSIPSSVAQSPWTEETNQVPKVDQAITSTIEKADHPASSNLHESTIVASAPNMQIQDASIVATPAPQARASTPEPQFSVKSFASFMSPSPKRRPRQVKRATWGDSGSRLPSTQGILASATKNPWECDSSQRRVSWAPLPHEAEKPSGLLVTRSPLLAKCRQASPPPTTPIADLPTSEDSKFHEHFNAVARRTNLLHATAVCQGLLPSESQRTVGSPAPDAMAETFLTADQLRQRNHLANQTRSDRETEESQDPLDMVEDVFREMGDFLEQWDVDNAHTPQAAQGVQSPW